MKQTHFNGHYRGSLQFVQLVDHIVICFVVSVGNTAFLRAVVINEVSSMPKNRAV